MSARDGFNGGADVTAEAQIPMVCDSGRFGCYSLSRGQAWERRLMKAMMATVYVGAQDVLYDVMCRLQEHRAQGEAADANDVAVTAKLVDSTNAYMAGLYKALVDVNADSYDALAASRFVAETLVRERRLPEINEVTDFVKYNNGAANMGFHKPHQEIIETEDQREARVKGILEAEKREDEARKREGRPPRTRIKFPGWDEPRALSHNAAVGLEFQTPQGFDRIFNGLKPWSQKGVALMAHAELSETLAQRDDDEPYIVAQFGRQGKPEPVS